MLVAKMLTALGACTLALGTAAEARQQDFALSSTGAIALSATGSRSEEHTSELQSPI